MNLKKKVENLLLIGLIVIISFFTSGCGQKIIPFMSISSCTAPIKPLLPIFEYKSLESEVNIDVLLKRDDYFRQYTKGLEDTITCYEILVKKEKN